MAFPFLLPLIPWLAPIVISLIGGTIVCTVAFITISAIREAIVEAAKKKKIKALSGKIKDIIRSNDYSEVTVDLLGINNKRVETIKVKGDNIDSSISQGMIIEL